MDTVVSEAFVFMLLVGLFAGGFGDEKEQQDFGVLWWAVVGHQPG